MGSRAQFELIPRSEQCSIAVREFQLPAFASPWHFHPEVELTDILSSHGKRFIGDHIAQIAYASGFESLSNFHRCFQALSGLSPTQFRNEHRTRPEASPHRTTR